MNTDKGIDEIKNQESEEKKVYCDR